MERAAGIEPASSAWKAEVIAIIRCPQHVTLNELFPKEYGGGGRIRTIEGGVPSDLQSDPFGHSGTPPDFGAFFGYCLFKNQPASENLVPTAGVELATY